MLALKLSMSLGNKGSLTAAQVIANAFKSRVIAGGGTFESKACLNEQLLILSNIQ